MFVFGSRRGTLSRFIVKWFTHFTAWARSECSGGVYRDDTVCNDLAVSLLCWLRAKCPGLSLVCEWMEGTKSQSSSLNRNERWSLKLPTCSPNIRSFFCVRVWSLSQSRHVVSFVRERARISAVCFSCSRSLFYLTTMPWLLGGVNKLETNLWFLINRHLAHFWTFFAVLFSSKRVPWPPNTARELKIFALSRAPEAAERKNCFKLEMLKMLEIFSFYIFSSLSSGVGEVWIGHTIFYSKLVLFELDIIMNFHQNFKNSIFR